ncbi:MAG: hypothetical protein H0U27_12110 [Nitrosopumilus sp.]|nr:hypothetical protein [Nitrosopumilus sp.]
MKKFSIMNKLYISIILGISIILTPQLISSTSYGQNNSIISDGSTVSLNKTLTDSTTNTTTDSISIPISKGYVDGNLSYFISTDASEKNIVSSVSNSTKFDVNYAPSLADTPESSRQQGYVFTNGIKGNSPFEFQLPVASATPDDEGYSPLFEINYVKWNDESNAKVLKSANEVLESKKNGELTITKSNIVINSPFVHIK